MTKGSAVMMFRASEMDSCSAHRDAGNHPYENNPLETLQSDGHKPSQCHLPSDNKTIANNWANWLPRFAVAACSFVSCSVLCCLLNSF